MAGSEYLIVIAEIAVAFAGFTSIVAVFQQRRKDWSALQAQTVGPVLSLGVHDNRLGNGDTANVLVGFQAGVGFAVPLRGWGLGVGCYVHDLRPLGEADRSYRGLALSLMVARRRGG